MTPSGDMTGMRDRKSGGALPDLSGVAQEAMLRLAQRVLRIMTIGQIAPRERQDLVASLDALSVIHGRGTIGGGAPSRRAELVRVNASRVRDCWTVDTQFAKAEAARVFSDGGCIDIEINFPEVGFAPCCGRLEDAPSGSQISIDPKNPPNWIDP